MEKPDAFVSGFSGFDLLLGKILELLPARAPGEDAILAELCCGLFIILLNDVAPTFVGVMDLEFSGQHFAYLSRDIGPFFPTWGQFALFSSVAGGFALFVDERRVEARKIR